MALYRDHGVILRTYKLGEADRIVSFVTERHGKIRAVAKGVRKTKSKFGSRLEPPTHVSLQLYEGRELDIVTQVETVDHFRAIREDLDRLTRAVTMLEAVDQLALEREPNPDLYRMLVGGLRALADRNSALVVAGFHWKALALEGFRPVVDQCVHCGVTDALVAFGEHMVKVIGIRRGAGNLKFLLRVDATVYYSQVLPVMELLQAAMIDAELDPTKGETMLDIVAYMPQD